MTEDLSTVPQTDHCRALYRVARAVNSSLDVMEVLQVVVSSVTEALGVRACSLRLLDPEGVRLFVGASHGLSPAYRAKGPVDVALSAIDQRVLAGRSPAYVADVSADGGFQYPEQAREEGIVSVLVLPLLVQDRPIGVLRVYTGKLHAFDEAEMELISAISSLSAIAIENARLYERLHHNYRAAVDFSDRSFQ